MVFWGIGLRRCHAIVHGQREKGFRQALSYTGSFRFSHSENIRAVKHGEVAVVAG
jgi:hypothetical protein